MTSFDSVLPLYAAETFSWGPTAAGLIFLPVVIPGFIAPLFGAISDRYGPRWLVVGGFLLSVPILVCLRFVDQNTIREKVILCVLLALVGTTLAAVGPPLMAEITYILEAKEKRQPGLYGEKGAFAQAYGLFVMSFAAGCLVGPIWAGFVEEQAGWATMAWSLGILSLGGAVPALIWTGGLITQRNAKSRDERAMGVAKIKTRDEEAGVVENV
jgi:MFS family permease